MTTIGILGVGHLAVAVVDGLIRAGTAPDKLLLSPRGRAQSVAAQHAVPVASDNDDLVRRSNLVLLAVRPAAATSAVRGLPWRPGHLLVSACAGISIGTLQAEVPAARIVRIMPLTASAFGHSATSLYPDVAEARILLDPLGPVTVLDTEAEFEAATVSAAAYGWALALIRRNMIWAERHGLASTSARRLSALTFAAAAQMAASSDQPLEELLNELVTPGGITEEGLRHLEKSGVFPAWEDACSAVLRKLGS